LFSKGNKTINLPFMVYVFTSIHFKMFRNLFIILYLLIIIANIDAQLVPGEWKDYLPYRITSKVAVAGNRIYCCSLYGLFYYDKSDLSINTISKVQGLSEVEIQSIAYVPKMDGLIIAYSNSNIDVLQKNKVYNIPFIKNKLSIPDKKINDILVIDDKAFLSCNFGIVELDLNKKLVDDTYYPSSEELGNKVNHLCNDSKNFYAATENGIYKAKIDDPFLVNYNNWEKISGYPNSTRSCTEIEYVSGRIFALFHNDYTMNNDSLLYYNGNTWQRYDLGFKTWISSINSSSGKLLFTCYSFIGEIDENLKLKKIGEWACFPTYGEYDNEDNLWVSDNEFSLIRFKNDVKNGVFIPNSPKFKNITGIDNSNGEIWTVCGGKGQAWEPLYNWQGAQAYFDNAWHFFNANQTKGFEPVRDLIKVKISPKDPEIVYLASWSIGGLIEYNYGNLKFFDNKNSSLVPVSDGSYRVYGLSFDQSDNLWITNSFSDKQLCVFTSDGKWYSYSLGSYAINSYFIGDVLATSWGHKWVVIAKTSSVAIFDESGTFKDESDDRLTLVNLANVESLIQSTVIYCIAEDKSGNIWLGTDAGPVVFGNPQDAFGEQGISAYKIKVPIAGSKNEAAYLLETERIMCIAIDGANRKWLGTQSSGVYLVSDDGIKQISHFTADNSPLLSNSIFDISIDKKNGTIFFATENGLISYRGFATEGGQNFEKVYVYPNPIRENYSGDIIITGLIPETIIKITDISGNLVFETKSLGGQAVWNGKNLLKQRVSTGVYLVFCSNSDGTKTYVTKLLFIH
jgi:hypothetical protein